MTIGVLIIWITGVTAFSLLGSWYARKFKRADLLIGLYVTFINVAQILAVKISAFHLGSQTFFGPSGLIVFAVTFLITDIVNEKFGPREARKMILIGFTSQVALSLFLWLGVLMEPAPFWGLQNSWTQIFGTVPRIVLASWVAFLVSENLDVLLFSWLKKLTGNKHIWIRNVFSSIPALAIDSILFIVIAFSGAGTLWPLIKGQILIKWLVGLVSVPFMYLNRWIIDKGD